MSFSAMGRGFYGGLRGRYKWTANVLEALKRAKYDCDPSGTLESYEKSKVVGDFLSDSSVDVLANRGGSGDV